jgi:hypothetical protein
MPLRDHFHPPISTRSSWEGFHGGWPMAIVQRLSPLLPDDFTAEPRVHLGAYFEIDVCAYEGDGTSQPEFSARRDSGGVATARYAPPQPTLEIDGDLATEYAYEVLVYDQSHGRRLVAAVEIVSPANKDRAESRRAFAMKCAFLLHQGVCVSIVDVVTTRHYNLYTDVLTLLGHADPAFAANPPIYAVTCRTRQLGSAPRLEAWAYPLTVGMPLPGLPVWLTDELHVSLELEESYEETCRVLRVDRS